MVGRQSEGALIMPTGWQFSCVQRRLDTDHSKRLDRTGRGIKIPNDFRRGGRSKSRH